VTSEPQNIIPCTQEELKILEDEGSRIRKNMVYGFIASLIFAMVMPWLGSSKTHGRPMVDFMSYPAAILSIMAVLGFIILSYYLWNMPKINKDLKEKTKVVQTTTITGKDTQVYKKLKGLYLSLGNMPLQLKRVAATYEEFADYKENDVVTVEYFPNSKKVIKFYKAMSGQ